MKKITTKSNSGFLYESPECTSIYIEALVPLCTSNADDEGESGVFDEEIWGKEYRL